MLTGNKTNKMTKFWWGHAKNRSINECIVYSSGYLISWPDHKCLLLFFPVNKNPRNHNRALGRTKGALATEVLVISMSH